MGKTLVELSDEITEWQDSVFTKATPLSATTHLKKEVLELAIDLINCDYEKARIEIADCFLLIIAVAHLSGIDLEASIEEKMAINRRRVWGEPDAYGVVEHVRGTLVEIFGDDKLPENFANLFSGLTKEGEDGTL